LDGASIGWSPHAGPVVESAPVVGSGVVVLVVVVAVAVAVTVVMVPVVLVVAGLLLVPVSSLVSGVVPAVVPVVFVASLFGVQPTSSASASQGDRRGRGGAHEDGSGMLGDTADPRAGVQSAIAVGEMVIAVYL
jgi:hypothetical protein